MMQPNQINNQRFTLVGKGGYKAIEVDAFIQRVFQNYNKLYNDNNILKERLSAITPLIEEYNENKKAIADALIWAKTTSDKTVEQAQRESKEIIDAATAEGDKIIAEKTAEAQNVYSQELNEAKTALENVKSELEMTRNQAKSFSERYIAEINSKASTLINEANENASKIVADAYKDAQTAREKADSIILKANEELLSIKAEASKLRSEIERTIKIAAEAAAEITVDEIEVQTIPEDEIIKAGKIDITEIDDFDFTDDMLTEDSIDAFEIEQPAENESSLVVEDITDGSSYETTIKNEDFISGGTTASSMPDVSAYISKIFESAGSDDSDFSSFADGLDDAFSKSLEENDISFDDLKMAMESKNDE